MAHSYSQGAKGGSADWTVDAIVEAAVQVADTGGLDAVSMARVVKGVRGLLRAGIASIA